jgi:hypothetical protein
MYCHGPAARHSFWVPSKTICFFGPLLGGDAHSQAQDPGPETNPDTPRIPIRNPDTLQAPAYRCTQTLTYPHDLRLSSFHCISPRAHKVYTLGLTRLAGAYLIP